jgi:caa(3)-type oxidase subunit IV
MTSNARKQIVFVWGVLVALTIAMWGIGVEHYRSVHPGGDSAMAVVLAIAFAKTLAVGSVFMELRTAPTPLRLVFAVWAIGVGSIITGLYLWL